ncbi:hypothetical protein BIFDEN_00318 [Bifidobacterium dentium ATCC 27678]|nr:hypothetical protein BIFDEN_00318 [Bifidobacterium dentium ATCC 27678]
MNKGLPWAAQVVYNGLSGFAVVGWYKDFSLGRRCEETGV